MKFRLLAAVLLALCSGCKDDPAVTPQVYARQRVSIVKAWRGGQVTTTTAVNSLVMLRGELEEYACDHAVSDNDRKMIAHADTFGIN